MFKNFYSIITVIIFLFSENIFSKTTSEQFLYYIGGGGEPTTADSTIFDSGVQSLSMYLGQAKWNTYVRFNGGHKLTEALLQNDLPQNVDLGKINPDNFDKFIFDVKNKIQNQTKEGSQILLIIDSHGALKNKSGNEKTHSIAIGSAKGPINYSTLSTSAVTSLDKLEKVAQLAEKKKIRLAIVDLSCHSGNTQFVANDYTCVISASHDNLYSFTSFSTQFLKGLSKGKSLEDLYLETRSADNLPSLPQISSPAGQQLYNLEKGGFSTFLYFGDKPNDKLNDLIQVEASTCLSCSEPSEKRAQQALKQVQNLIRDAQLQGVDTQNLEALLRTYQAHQKAITETVAKWGASELGRIEKFELSKTPVTYKWASILTGAWEGNAKYFEQKAKNEKDFKERTENLERSKLMLKLAEKQKEIIEKYPKLKNYSQELSNLIQNTGNSFKMAMDISKEERKVYNAIYAELSKKEKGSNACKDFKL